MTKHEEFDVGFDLELTTVDRITGEGGTWVCGTLHDHRFTALVFPEHAENESYELGTSRLSKLWVQRLADKTTTYNWDRGLDQPAADILTQAIVDFLAGGLANHVYAT